jgi:hypothetical protein
LGKTIAGIENGQSPKLYPEGVAHSGNKMTKSGEQNKYLTGSSDEVLNLYAQTACDLIAELQQSGIRHSKKYRLDYQVVRWQDCFFGDGKHQSGFATYSRKAHIRFC